VNILVNLFKVSFYLNIIMVEQDNNRFDIYLKMIETRIDQLVQIYITNRKEHGLGMLFLNFCQKEKLDVFYNPIYDKEKECANEMFPKDLISYVTDNKTPDSIIYFNLFDNEGDFMLTIDLDKNGKFLNKK